MLEKEFCNTNVAAEAVVVVDAGSVSNSATVGSHLQQPRPRPLWREGQPQRPSLLSYILLMFNKRRSSWSVMFEFANLSEVAFQCVVGGSKNASHDRKKNTVSNLGNNVPGIRKSG